MGSERLTKMVYMSEMRGERGRGGPPSRRMDGVKKACTERRMGLEHTKGLCMDWNACRRMTDRTV